MARTRTGSIGAAAFALLLSACNLSMAGKDQCNGAGDCLVGYRCLKNRCVLESECPVVCGNTCCNVTERCDPLVTQCRPGCVPQCKGRQCGPDGCGGSCGDCGQGWSCNEESAFCDLCQPDCAGKQCGPDGCGRTCGSCNSWEMCTSKFTCVNAPADAGVIHRWDSGTISFGDAGMTMEDGGLVEPPDAGEPTDAAAEPPDAGEPLDGAAEPPDGGEPPDAAAEPADAAAFEVDAAVDFSDAGDLPDAEAAEPPDGAGL